MMLMMMMMQLLWFGEKRRRDHLGRLEQFQASGQEEAKSKNRNRGGMMQIIYGEIVVRVNRENREREREGKIGCQIIMVFCCS